MATQIDSLNINGMKQTDFMQLQNIFLNAIEDGSYYGRKDWWDERNSRLEKWLNEVNELLIDVKIKKL